MKFAFSFVVAFCAVSAYAVPGLVNTGHSAQFRSQDSLGNYAFGYNEDHATGGTFRRETGSPGIAQGSYGLRDIDGRMRVVNYVADGLGFRANIQTNEPGVDASQDPASVLINKAAAIVAPYLTKQVIAAPAPIAIQQSYEAPIIEHAPIVQKYEPAPAVLAPAPHYEAAPLIEAGPVLHKTYDAPLLSGYTTKTYAAPAPILSSYQHAPLAVAHPYATKGYAAAPLGLKSGLLSPAYAAKGLGAYLK